MRCANGRLSIGQRDGRYAFCRADFSKQHDERHANEAQDEHEFEDVVVGHHGGLLRDAAIHGRERGRRAEIGQVIRERGHVFGQSGMHQLRVPNEQGLHARNADTAAQIAQETEEGGTFVTVLRR